MSTDIVLRTIKHRIFIACLKEIWQTVKAKPLSAPPTPLPCPPCRCLYEMWQMVTAKPVSAPPPPALSPLQVPV